MSYSLSEFELEAIAQLPVGIQIWQDRYPLSVANTAADYERSPLPDGYIPNAIEVYYGDEEMDEADLFILNGKLHSVGNLQTPADPNVIQLMIDGYWAYIQVEGRIILDRLGGAIMPDILVNPEILALSILALQTSK